MSDDRPFGRVAATATGPDELLLLEQSRGVNRFFDFDQQLGQLVVRAVRGEQRVLVIRCRGRSELVSIPNQPAAGRAWLEDCFSVSRQQARGAWYVPEAARLRIGTVNLAWHFKVHARFATGSAADEHARVALDSAPEAVLTWAILEPLFANLFLPFELRGEPRGRESRKVRMEAWERACTFAEGLGFEAGHVLSKMRYGRGWSKLTAPEQLAIKLQLLDTLAVSVTARTAARYRALRLGELLRHYYAKATDGRARRRQVVTGDLQRVLSGFFGGDWLGFLEYIGEEPHPEELITTALATRMYVGGAERAQSVAIEHGVPVEEVKRMLASYWDQPASESPVDQRVRVLDRYWAALDVLHAQQAPGMRSLWGLVGTDGKLGYCPPSPYGMTVTFLDDEPYLPHLAEAYRELPSELLLTSSTCGVRRCLSTGPTGS